MVISKSDVIRSYIHDIKKFFQLTVKVTVLLSGRYDRHCLTSRSPHSSDPPNQCSLQSEIQDMQQVGRITDHLLHHVVPSDPCLFQCGNSVSVILHSRCPETVRMGDSWGITFGKMYELNIKCPLSYRRGLFLPICSKQHL